MTDNEGKTTQYEYQNQGGESQMITKITDKAGAVTNLAWYFADDAWVVVGAAPGSRAANLFTAAGFEQK